jgi:Predicted nucleoside-diphosphate-sugar epimerases
MKKVIVLGAPADQGIPLVGALKARGLAVTAGVRRPGAMAATVHPEVPEVPADIYDIASLTAAFAGHDALAMHLPFEFDRPRAATMGRNIAEAARIAGLKKIVFNTSCFVADRDLGLSAHDGRRDIERAIHDSGVPYVIIEPMVFMDNIIRIWSRPAIVNSGIFAYPAAETLKISWVCLEDVAAYMVSGLLHEDLIADRIAVGGPETLVGAEVAERLSLATGRTVRFQSLSPDEFAARMSELVTGSREVQPASIYDGMARFYRWYNDQPVSPLALDAVPAARLLKVIPTPFAAWAAQQDWSPVKMPA